MPTYRVQVRNIGEAWKTVSRWSGLEGACHEADRLATRQYQLGERWFPEHRHIQVLHGESLIYACDGRTEQHV